ncbi:unnamed protein product [Arctogadus glacialis]
MEDRAALLSTFQASFFAMTRLSPRHWERLRGELEKDKSPELIAAILKKTSLSPLAQKHPPSAKYRRSFLTELITMLEQMCLEPLDELYEGLAEVLSDQKSEDCYKTYLLAGGGAVTLTESVALVSQGTTGLVTWEAALHLAEWAGEHLEAFSGRVVLELGCGVGLTGLVVCRGCSPSRYVFSDFHPSVLRRLRANLELNGLGEEGPPGGAEGGGVVRVEELDWESVSEERLREIGADTVIASAQQLWSLSPLCWVFSDVLRPDPPPLVCEAALRCPQLFSPPLQLLRLICSPIRNPDTYNISQSSWRRSGAIRRSSVSGEAVMVTCRHGESAGRSGSSVIPSLLLVLEAPPAVLQSAPARGHLTRSLDAPRRSDSY